MQDVSKLLDACRQSIIFEGLPDLLQCLKRIGQDPEVKIVRIKNRMDACYDSTISAGYRDIVVNIRVDNPQTRDLGVETHVCEVQLLLKSFAILKVRFVNLKGSCPPIGMNHIGEGPAQVAVFESGAAACSCAMVESNNCAD